MCSYGSVKNNKTCIDDKNKKDEISTNRYLKENNGFPDGVYIDDMLAASAPNQYVNTEYNHEHHNIQINANISTSNNSSVSALNSPAVTSTNE